MSDLREASYILKMMRTQLKISLTLIHNQRQSVRMYPPLAYVLFNALIINIVQSYVFSGPTKNFNLCKEPNAA